MILSGSWLAFVGSHVGKFGLPDKDQSSVVNNFGCKCRVCRVFIEGERPEEIRTVDWNENGTADAKSNARGLWRPFWTPVGLRRAYIPAAGNGKSMKCFGGPGRVRTDDLVHAI